MAASAPARRHRTRRRHARPPQAAPAAPTPVHYARLGTERGKLPAAAATLTLADLPVQRRRSTATTAPDLAGAVQPAVSTPTASVPGSTSQVGLRPSDYQAAFDLTADELLTAVLDGKISLTDDHRGVRLSPGPASSPAAVSAVVTVRSPADHPVRAQQLLGATGWTIDDLLTDVLTGTLTVHRAPGGLRFEAADCGLPVPAAPCTGPVGQVAA